MRIWKLIAHHAQPGKTAFREHVARRRIAIGWTDVGDLVSIQPRTKDDIRALVKQFHPPLRENANGAPGLWRFYAEMQEGDYVIECDGGTRLGVFRVEGPYEYANEEDRVVGYAHVRDAELTAIDAEALWSALGGMDSVLDGEIRRGTLIELAPNDRATALIEAFETSEASGASREERPTRNPPWSRDELILALDLYMEHRASPLGKDAAQIVELSSVLNTLGDVIGQREAATYRNANGVYMKLMNFRRFDPDFAAKGKSGLARGNKDEELVWNKFAHDVPGLRRVAQLIREGISLDGAAGSLRNPEESWVEEAEEGQILTRIHRLRERDRRLVAAAKAAALNQHGRLQCVACGFDFVEHYGEAGEGVIDVHHTSPCIRFSRARRRRSQTSHSYARIAIESCTRAAVGYRSKA